MMNKEQKKNYISEMETQFQNNEAVMVTHYQGLTMSQLDELRAQMREHGIKFTITKNRITKIALKGSKAEKLEKFFKGPTAIACSKDPITLAKTLVTFSKSNEKLKILGGLMDEKLLEPSDVAHIATLPTLNEARAKIVGILAAPAQKIVSILLAPSAKIVNLMHAKNLKN